MLCRHHPHVGTIGIGFPTEVKSGGGVFYSIMTATYLYSLKDRTWVYRGIQAKSGPIPMESPITYDEIEKVFEQ